MRGFTDCSRACIYIKGKGTRRRGTEEYLMEQDRGNKRREIGDLAERRRATQWAIDVGHVIGHRHAETRPQ